MTNLLLKNVLNRKLQKFEKLQIAFDKKNNVERIFGEDGEDIYYVEKDNNKIFQKIGTLFLDYLSDNISEIFNKFIDDIMEKDIEIVKEKYINAYTFYFKYFFNDEYYIEQLKYVKGLSKEQTEEIKSIITDNIKNIENVATIDELVNNYTNIICKSKKVRKGTDFKNINEDNKHIALTGKFAKISNSFFRIAYLKQLYKLIIDYCYLRKTVLKTDVEKHDIAPRYFCFKKEYDKKIGNVINNAIIPHSSLPLPPSVATINENGEIIYCYQLDEVENVELIITNIFFNVSLIHLLESGNRIIKCENCNSYLVLKKNGTKFCNNPSPQNENQSCSEYMKNLKYKEKVRDNEVAKEEKRASDRVSRYYAVYFDRGSEKYSNKFEKWKEEKKNKKLQYEQDKISKAKYLEWLKSQKG